jgi:hypothetical protein
VLKVVRKLQEYFRSNDQQAELERQAAISKEAQFV